MTYLTGSMPCVETNEGPGYGPVSVSFGLGLDYVSRYSDIIAAVTVEEMLEAGRKYILPDRPLRAGRT